MQYSGQHISNSIAMDLVLTGIHVHVISAYFQGGRPQLRLGRPFPAPLRRRFRRRPPLPPGRCPQQRLLRQRAPMLSAPRHLSTAAVRLPPPRWRRVHVYYMYMHTCMRAPHAFGQPGQKFWGRRLQLQGGARPCTLYVHSDGRRALSTLALHVAILTYVN